MSLAAALFVAPAAGQEGAAPATVADLSQTARGGQGRDGLEVARGDEGDSITYTIVETPDTQAGDATTAVYPTTPAAPDLSRVPVPTDSEPTTVAPPTGEPASAPLDGNDDSGIAGDATLAGPSDEPAPLTAACVDFGSWYDAQVYYESMGGAGAASELVTALDPDVDGVACEELIEYS